MMGQNRRRDIVPCLLGGVEGFATPPTDLQECSEVPLPALLVWILRW